MGTDIHDSVPFEKMLDTIAHASSKPTRVRRRPSLLPTRRACVHRGEWVIARTFARIHRNRRLVARRERDSDIHHAAAAPACSPIWLNTLNGRFRTARSGRTNDRSWPWWMMRRHCGCAATAVSGMGVDLMSAAVGTTGAMNGRHVVDAARLARAELKVLFNTGSAGITVLDHGHLRRCTS